MPTVSIASESEMRAWIDELLATHRETPTKGSERLTWAARRSLGTVLHGAAQALTDYLRFAFLGGGSGLLGARTTPRPRTWEPPLPSVLVVGSPDPVARWLRLLGEAVGTFPGDPWDLRDREWSSTPDDLNYLAGVLGEVVSGWPITMLHLEALPGDEARLLAKAARGKHLPWVEPDGSSGEVSFGQHPIVVFATATRPEDVDPDLADVFDVVLRRPS